MSSLGWNWFRAIRNWSSVSGFSQITKISSMYLTSRSGGCCCVFRKFLSITNMNMVGEKAAPMAVPCICWKNRLANWK